MNLINLVENIFYVKTLDILNFSRKSTLKIKINFHVFILWVIQFI